MGRSLLGEAHGEILKQAIVIIKKPSPRAIQAQQTRYKKRAQSARAARPAPIVEGSAETGFVHSLHREPDWRRVPLKGPAWDTSAAPVRA